MKINNVSFGAGLTPQLSAEIRKINLSQIRYNFAQKGISTNFNDNPIIAWCCNKVLEIIEFINQKYKQKLKLPTGIFVENFENLNIPNINMYGFCNLQPVKLFKKSDKIVPSKVIFFNSQENIAKQFHGLTDWNFINNLADKRYSENQSATGHFLDIFLHEFMHVAHEDRIIKKIGVKKFLNLLSLIKNEKYIAEYRAKYGTKLSQICNYALYNPFEAIACDMSKTITNTLNPISLMPFQNPFIDSPYEKLSFLKRIKLKTYSDKERPLFDILRNFWNGKFE